MTERRREYDEVNRRWVEIKITRVEAPKPTPPVSNRRREDTTPEVSDQIRADISGEDEGLGKIMYHGGFPEEEIY